MLIYNLKHFHGFSEMIIKGRHKSVNFCVEREVEVGEGLEGKERMERERERTSMLCVT